MARDRKRFGSSLAIVLLWAGSARAYDEQWSLDAAAGYALIASDDWPTRQGAGVDVGATLGVSDSVMLRGTLGYAYLADSDRHEHLGRLRAEGLYALDVLELVPFFGVGVTLTTAPLPEDERVIRPGVHLVLGLDYLASRTWTAGLDVRSGVLFVSGSLRSATDVSLRVSRMFEFF
ncbi:MAG TPA: hypothetical protein VFX59_07800 [Polyangiales bacterium]|nr:hypothetical protein [Polyangiales bacterium]